MAEYRLHCFAQSGNAYKAALMLELSKADWEPVFVDFFNGENRGEAFQALNTMGEVPILEHGGQTLSQSAVILDHLSQTLGTFGSRDSAEAREIMRWLFWDNHKLSANVAIYRFITNFLPEDKRSPDVVAFVGGRMGAALKTLEKHLANREWIVGEAMTIVDLSCIGYFYYADEWGFDGEKFPAIKAWSDRIRAVPGWKHPYDLMPGHPLPNKKSGGN